MTGMNNTTNWRDNIESPTEGEDLGGGTMLLEADDDAAATDPALVGVGAPAVLEPLMDDGKKFGDGEEEEEDDLDGEEGLDEEDAAEDEEGEFDEDDDLEDDEDEFFDDDEEDDDLDDDMDDDEDDDF